MATFSLGTFAQCQSMILTGFFKYPLQNLGMPMVLVDTHAVSVQSTILSPAQALVQV